jgi:hypothetical protein
MLMLVDAMISAIGRPQAGRGALGGANAGRRVGRGCIIETFRPQAVRVAMHGCDAVALAPHEARSRRRAATAARRTCRAPSAAVDDCSCVVAEPAAARGNVPANTASAPAGTEKIDGAHCRRGRLLPSASCAGGSVRERSVGAANYPAPERLQPVTPAAVHSAGAVAFIHLPSSGVVIRSAAVAPAAARCCRPGPATRSHGTVSVGVAARGVCGVARVPLTGRLGRVVGSAAGMLRRRVPTATADVLEVPSTLATSVQGALG